MGNVHEEIDRAISRPEVPESWCDVRSINIVLARPLHLRMLGP